MSKQMKIEFISAGFREILASDGVKALVDEATTEIQSKANANCPEHSNGYEKTVMYGNYGGGRWVGFVQCTDSFHSQANVLNGASELFMAIFGDGAGQAARSALGTNALPLDAMVEVEAVVKLKD